jgi:phenylacetate-CoA ligase
MTVGTTRAMLASGHDAVSQRLLRPLTRMHRRIRPSYRRALAAFDDGMAFRVAAENWGEDRRREWMLARLRAVVRAAEDGSAYYRELFRRCDFDPNRLFDFDDFARLPILEREDVHRAGAAMIDARIEAAALRRDATGGSTGVPTVVWLGPLERGWIESGLEYFMRRVGIPRGTRVAYIWGHHLDPVARSGWRDRARDFAENVRWFECFRLSTDVLTRYHTELQAYRPAGIIAYASALGALAEEIERRGWRATYPTGAVVSGAEKLLAQHRVVAERVLGRPVHERYGCRDVGLIGMQCQVPRTLDYDVDWGNVLVEPETTHKVSSILVTKLHADGMPMLRYRVGDVGHFPAGSRPGTPVMTLHDVLGREVDRILLPGGGWVQGFEFPHLLKDYAVRQFQVVQRRDFSVVVRVVPRDGFGPTTEEAIKAVVAANLPGVSVTLEVIGALPPTAASKWRVVASQLDDHGAVGQVG